MAETDLPWLQFTGQSTAELLACAETHDRGSLLYAFELGIEARIEAEGTDGATDEEVLVLAVMALEREVNNGGFDQFFVNSSRRFEPVIVDCLRRIGRSDVAEIAARAIANRGEEVLNRCDTEFYRLPGLRPQLFRFIQENRDKIRTGTPKRIMPVPRLRKPKPTTKLWTRLMLSKHGDPDLDGVRRLAREIVSRDGLEVTQEELESAAVLYAFGRSIAGGDTARSADLAELAWEKSRRLPLHGVLHRKWVERLIEAGQHGAADEQSLRYLNDVAGRDPNDLATQNHVLYWASLLQAHPTALPRSVEFFRTNFPEENLYAPLPGMRFTPLPRPPRQ